MKRRILAVLLSLCLSISLLPMTAFAVENNPADPSENTETAETPTQEATGEDTESSEDQEEGPEVTCVVAIGDQEYETLAAAITAVNNAQDSEDSQVPVITLLTDVELSETVSITKSATIDLNGKTITGNNVRALQVKSGTLTLTGEGTVTTTATEGDNAIDSSSSVIRVGDNGTEVESKADAALIIEKNVTVNAPATYGVTVFGSATTETLTVYGKVIASGDASAISGNGSEQYAGTAITIKDSAVVSATSDLAIYHPQSGSLTIEGGTISGPGGIEMKAGTLAITGTPSITATARDTSYNENSNGPSSSGYAVAVVNNTAYTGSATVVIEDGTYNGDIAILDDAEGTDSEQSGSITITGGTFSSDVSEFAQEGYTAVQDEDGNYVLAELAIKTVGYVLNGATANEVTGITDGADYTMYVQMNGKVPAGTYLWFVIKAENGTTYGIAANPGYTTYCWSFLNNGQFESWPEGVEPGAPTAGEYTVTAYRTDTLVTADTAKTLDVSTLEEIGSDTVTVSAVPQTIEAGYILKGTNAADVLGEGSWADYTMYVKFSEALPNGTNLWYVITAPNGVTYGIAGEVSTLDSGKATTAHAWSFLNAGQFESWPEGVEPGAPAQGEYTITIYETEDLITSNNIPEDLQTLTQIGDALTVGVVSQEYTITFAPNNGTLPEETNASVTTVNGQLTDLPTPTRSGSYRFDGWYTEDGDQVTTDTVFYANATITAHWTYTGGSSGGGGGSSSSSYSVTANTPANGSLTISPKSASKGTTVTITVAPSSGYALETLTATDASGNKLTLTDKGDGTYIFTMPASKVMVSATFAASTTPSTGRFNDVAASDYYYDAVEWAVDQGITTGTSATTFSPNASCTRAQMVTFLWRANGSPAASGENPFTDVKSGAYYYDAVLWAVEKGITKGTSDTTFSPDQTVTRGQTVTFLYRSDGAPAVTGDNSFTDVAADAYYADAVQWAVNESITTGTSAATFSPLDNCTRGQIVTFLYRGAK